MCFLAHRHLADQRRHETATLVCARTKTRVHTPPTNGGPQVRVSSPTRGRSTLITSAPKSARVCCAMRQRCSHKLCVGAAVPSYTLGRPECGTNPAHACLVVGLRTMTHQAPHFLLCRHRRPFRFWKIVCCNWHPEAVAICGVYPCLPSLCVAEYRWLTPFACRG